MSVEEIRKKLRRLGSREKATFLQRFFKTGPGEYAEGDVLLGVTVPENRKLAKQYRDSSLSEVRQLLRSAIHEERLLALFILVLKFRKGDERDRKRIYELYLKSTKHINNWDLVDSSAEQIVGAYLVDKSRDPIHRLAKSTSLWERRIAIISTYHFIKGDEFADTLKIAKLLVRDEEDLIHKAVGWMLREVGKRDLPAEERFLKAHAKTMPRTMLRYAIERFPEPKRQRYLKGKF